jgi:hypothetical protein
MDTSFAAVALAAALSVSDHSVQVDAQAKFLSWGIALPQATLAWAYEPSGEPGFVRGQMPGLIASAAHEWSSVCDVRIVRGSYKRSLQQPNATIRWTAPGELPYGIAGWASLAVSATSHGAFISSVDIQLDPLKVFSAQQVRELVRHELGHAIGVAHSDIEGSVMSGPPFTSYAFPSALQPDDIAGCRSLYSTGPTR